MFEIIKILASGLVTFFAVWIGAKLSQNTQMRHLLAQDITGNNNKWKEDFKNDIAQMISYLRVTQAIYSMNYSTEDIKNDFINNKVVEDLRQFTCNVQPKSHEIFTRIKLSLNPENKLHKQLLDKIYEMIFISTSREHYKHYNAQKISLDCNEIISLSQQIKSEKDNEAFRKIKNLKYSLS